jgi:lipopolysaccharide/colanic/teichoic acid biosynthesis glycosyltransferase
MIARSKASSFEFDCEFGAMIAGALNPAQTRVRFNKPRVRRPVKSAPRYSLAIERLEQGQAFVKPAGNQTSAYLIAKRALDIVGALGLVVALSPVMLTAVIVLTITTKGRPLFVQKRLGFLGRQFPMIKFRTMRLDAAKMQAQVVNEKDGPIFKNRRDPRITRVGRFLRSTSIDEMPQLFNVLAGHMSLVGPRPPLASEVAKYEPWQRQRLAIIPGLTCLWQIGGRSEIGFVDWVRLDLAYMKQQSLWTDLGILIRTPASVLSGKGAY